MEVSQILCTLKLLAFGLSQIVMRKNTLLMMLWFLVRCGCKSDEWFMLVPLVADKNRDTNNQGGVVRTKFRGLLQQAFPVTAAWRVLKMQRSVFRFGGCRGIVTKCPAIESENKFDDKPLLPDDGLTFTDDEIN